MDTKKIVKKFLAPNWIPMIICLLIPGVNVLALLSILFNYLPRQLRANKCVQKLEAEDKLDDAAADILSGDSKRFMKGKLVMGADAVYSKGQGYAIAYSDVVWAYKHTQTYALLFFPIARINSLQLAVGTAAPTGVASMGRDKTDEVKNAIVEIYRHNPNCLVGYTDDARAKYKALRKG